MYVLKHITVSIIKTNFKSKKLIDHSFKILFKNKQANKLPNSRPNPSMERESGHRIPLIVIEQITIVSCRGRDR